MNYRHAFHAGNFADVMKHAVVAQILAHLLGKPKPFRFIDTHAGIGLYDLGGQEASRTREWRGGIGLLNAPLTDTAEAALRPYRDVLATVRARHGANAYPGSPALAREMLRPCDRAVLVEKHPDDAAALSRRFRTAGAFKVLAMDGWTGLGSLIPPPERRGLVLIDPPYEEPGEMDRALARVAKATRKWPTGIFALWYPVKSPAAVERALRPILFEAGAGALRLELLVGRLASGGGLTGSGMIVFNPPWTLAGEANALLPALASRLGGSDATFRVETLRGTSPAAV